MAASQRVVLYGNTLFMAGMEASLGSLPGLSVFRMEATSSPDAREQLAEILPDAVIFELAAFPIHEMLELTCAPPGRETAKKAPRPYLIGLDVHNPTVFIFSGGDTVEALPFPCSSQTAYELAQIIRRLPGH